MPTYSPPFHQVPILETERLRLRSYQSADFPAYLAMMDDPAVYRYLTPGPPSEEESYTRILRMVGHWALRGFGFWAVEEKASGQFIGVLGFIEVMRQIEPSLKGYPEIGWVLAAPAHGKGYATEGVTAALAWADAHFGPTRMVCLMDPENVASRRVAEKFGFREFARTTYHGEPALLLERLPGGDDAPPVGK
ncbi:GNAT family N-acetyltransferase [Hymenobacter sp. ASUV-10]|uniref:GNAT family N-acetyltransferase n=1 Tax=Hymenobacter aranciens TaxID=3063996 RepID=A0ABT9B6Z4_9BACT|nr:GNAT family N-acetyltransferase [Hymenobacter sp. ASUV-10]MDO7873474.1 GNAT family N-acetyltransferase [Hymenobacter sp. ASUV-10]